MDSVTLFFQLVFATVLDAISFSSSELSVKTRFGVLYAELDGKKWVISAEGADGSFRQISYHGQRSRMASLIEALESDNDGRAIKIAESLLNYQMQQVTVDIWQFIQLGSRVKFLKSVKAWRRESFLGADDKICVVLKEANDASIADAVSYIETLEDFDASDSSLEVDHQKFQKGTEMESAVKAIADNYQGFEFLGGNPDNGVLLLTKSTTPATNAGAQKLAKIKLSGGIKAFNHSIKFKLVEFPKSFDGLYAIVSSTTCREFADANALVGKIFQSRVYSDGKYAIKGLMVEAGVTTKVNKLFIDNGYDNILDINEYAKTFGLNANVGDFVDVCEFMVLTTDANAGNRDVNVSWQMVNRAPKAVRPELLSFMKSSIQEMKDEAKANPISFIPDFGSGRIIKDLKNPIHSDKMNYNTDAAKELRYRVNRFFKKGPQVKGAYLINLPGNVADDECLISSKAAKKMGLAKGDRINVAVYPALLPTTANSSAFIFSKKIVGFLDCGAIVLSERSNAAALRDFDGDYLVCFAPKKVGVEFPVQDYTIFSAKTKEITPLVKKLNSTYSHDEACELFVNYGSSVGKIDNMVSTAAILLDLDEDQIIFLNKCIQADIESKKHAIEAGFGDSDLYNWMVTNCPDAFVEAISAKGNPYQKFQKHANIKLNYCLVQEECLTVEVSELVLIARSIKLSAIETISIEDFKRKADNIYRSLSSKFSDSTFNAIEKIADLLKEISIDRATSIDCKSSKIRSISRQIEKQVGQEQFYLISVGLLRSSKFSRGLFAPLVFAGSQNRKDVDSSKVNIVFTSKIADFSASTRSGSAVEFKKSSIGSIVRVWRSKAEPCVVAGAPVIAGGAVVEIVDGKAIIDGQTFNVNFDKSMTVVDGDQYLVTAVNAILGKDGAMLSTGLDLIVED